MPNYPYDDLTAPLDTANLAKVNQNYDKIQADIQSVTSSTTQQINAFTIPFNERLYAQQSEYTSRLNVQQSEYTRKFDVQRKEYTSGFQTQKSRIDNIVNEVSGDAFDQVVSSAVVNWLQPVGNFGALATTYPAPNEGDAAQTLDDNKTYRFDGQSWVFIQQFGVGPFTPVFERLDEQDYYANVRAFGAVGDGVTDDTDAIQAAFDSLQTSSKKGVIFPDGGVYMVSSTILYDSNTVILGEQSTLKLVYGLETLERVLMGPRTDEVENVFVEKLKLDHSGEFYGNNGRSPCFSVQRTINMTIKNCDFLNAQTMAVWCDDNASLTKNLNLVDNLIVNSFGGGFSVFGEIDGIKITGNTVNNCRDDGIALQPATSDKTKRPRNAVITGNIVKDCNVQDELGSTARGIINESGINVVIKNNTIENTYSHSIYVFEENNSASLNTIIEGNTCINAGNGNTGTVTPASGIDVRGLNGKSISNVIVKNNIIQGPKWNGIYANTNSSIISNNTVQSAGHSGIFLTGTNNSDISSNILENTGIAGINDIGIFLVEQNARNTISKNRVFGPDVQAGITLLSGNNDNRVSSNDLTGVQVVSIQDSGSRNEKRANVLKSGFPLRKYETLVGINETTFGITGLSSSAGSSVVLNPLNQSAMVLLAGGYRLTVFDEYVELRTVLGSTGTEQIEFCVI